jgi:hypothetical protein
MLQSVNMERIKSLKEFWPFYLEEHSRFSNRRLHFIGTSLSLAFLVFFGITLRYEFLILALLSGYSFAWVGHFFIEKNKPATFQYPIWSFISDWKMYLYIWLGIIEKEYKLIHSQKK